MLRRQPDTFRQQQFDNPRVRRSQVVGIPCVHRLLQQRRKVQEQRRLPVFFPNCRIRAVLQQQLDNFDRVLREIIHMPRNLRAGRRFPGDLHCGIRVRSVSGPQRCNHQGRVAGLALDIGVGAGLQQQSDDLRVGSV